MQSQKEIYNRRRLADLIREVCRLWGEQNCDWYVDDQLKLWSNTPERQYQAFKCFEDLKQQALAIGKKNGQPVKKQ